MLVGGPPKRYSQNTTRETHQIPHPNTLTAWQSCDNGQHLPIYRSVAYPSRLDCMLSACLFRSDDYIQPVSDKLHNIHKAGFPIAQVPGNGSAISKRKKKENTRNNFRAMAYTPIFRMGLGTRLIVRMHHPFNSCSTCDFCNQSFHYATDRQLLGGKTNWAIQSLIPQISFYLGCGHDVKKKKRKKNTRNFMV